MVAVQVLDENDDMQAECHDDGVNLSIVSEISLPPLRVSSIGGRIWNDFTLA